MCDAGTTYEIDVLSNNEDDLSKFGEVQIYKFTIEVDIKYFDIGVKVHFLEPPTSHV